ncbi:MAG: ComEA family DNA-binding protein [Clostridiales bacterium]|nr:ComEA family DNA-binding protein [Clostridiales bacterium]
MDKRRVCITLIMVGLGISACVFSSLRSGKEPIEIEMPASSSQDVYQTENAEILQETSRSFPVYICGEVCFPGIYEVEDSVYLYELIDMAGGLTDKADAAHIDMVYRIKKEESIYIPSVEDEESESGSGVIRIPSKEESASSEECGKVNINTADEQQLSTLSGIGEKTAQKIVNYREENGPFMTTEDLMKVPGIGESKYAAIKDNIYV